MSKFKDLMRIVNERDRYKADLERQIKESKEYREITDDVFEYYAEKLESDTAREREKFNIWLTGRALRKSFEMPSWYFRRPLREQETKPEKFVYELDEKTGPEPMPAVCPECGAAPEPGFNGTHYEDCSQLGTLDCVLRQEKERDA